jgi:hypothetical protein
MRIPLPAPLKHNVGQRATQFLIHQLYPLLDSTPQQEGQPFPQPYPMQPHHDSRQIGWTHYGVMIPDLVAPHRFFSIMSILGSPGALAFDTDHARVTSPRRNAAVVSGTAATHPHLFRSYAMDRDCDLRSDGSLIQFGSDLTLSGSYPDYHVSAHYADFELEIDIHNTDKVSWFVKTPIYDHLSLLSTYSGFITWQGQRQAISGLCTFEYAACISPYLLRDQPLPPALKIPLDFFTYQIINLDERTQLLLNETRINGVKAVSKAYLRGLDDYSHSYDAVFEVLTEQATPAIAPDGVSMTLPHTFRWTIYHRDQVILTLDGTVDTPFTYGLGSGYVGGYAYNGLHHDQPIAGRGYIEYIDRR